MLLNDGLLTINGLSFRLSNDGLVAAAAEQRQAVAAAAEQQQAVAAAAEQRQAFADACPLLALSLDGKMIASLSCSFYYDASLWQIGS